MTAYVHWNRRSGVDRRQLQGNDTNAQRRALDRRQLPNNDYLLIVGRTGLDSFELLVTVSISTMIMAMVVGSYLGNM